MASAGRRRYVLRMQRWAAVLGLILASGCGNALYFVRDTPEPMRALEVRMDPTERRSCLVVFMPGMLDTPDSFRDAGFLDDAARASRRCDFVAVDAHFGYYRTGQVRERVREDVLRLAEARGYDEFWIVGISMGGMGTLLVAQENEARVRGVVLLAPFLGDEAITDAIDEAGGLERWQAPDGLDPYDDEEFDDAMWAWLQGYAREGEARPEMYLGLGTEDRRHGVEILAANNPPGHYGTTPGGHDWSTWRVLWRRLLRSPPWDPRPGRPPSMAEPPTATALRGR